jgi:hypothetical protein
MLRWIFFLRYPDGVSKDEGERWYLGTHTQEAKRLRGLRRYRSWRAQPATVAPPWTTVERLNRWDRVTELVWDDWAAWHDGAVVHVPQYTPAPYGPRGFESETIFIDETPDDDFLGNSPAPDSLPPAESDRLIRWLFLLRYPETITKEEGEAWYLGTHTQEAKHMHGLRRYVSWKAAQRPPELPARGPSKWDRLTELAFADFDAWAEGAVTEMPRWTPPPYGNPGFLSETVFIREQPEYDFLKEVPRLP